jgi:hypothetical protein
MFIVRDIMYCRPGKVRAMADKFLAVGRAGAKLGFGTMRVMTDVSAERYWTVVAEVEVKSLDEYEAMSRRSAETPELRDIMQGYHELVEYGRREIYKLEG